VDSEWRDQDGDSREGDCHQCQPSDRPASEALTSIHGTYTLASPHGPNANEVDSLMVKHFLDALAEVALAIASRQVKPWTP